MFYNENSCACATSVVSVKTLIDCCKQNNSNKLKTFKRIKYMQV